MSQQRYTFTRDDLDAWTERNDEHGTMNDKSKRSAFSVHRSSLPPTVPWYWALLAWSIGCLCGTIFMLVLLLVTIV